MLRLEHTIIIWKYVKIVSIGYYLFVMEESELNAKN
jgi:hypothetical protein